MRVVSGTAAKLVLNVVVAPTESLERGVPGQRENGTSGCRRHAWFTRAQARAFAACCGMGLNAPVFFSRSLLCGPLRLCALCVHLLPFGHQAVVAATSYR